MDEVLEKSGQDLFKEILRIYDTAEFEDYFKAGSWKTDLMRTDYVLLTAHRKEAGAPDPPALEDVVLPEGLAKTTVAKTLLPGAAAAAVNGGGPVAELRLIALFVAKWKLDPTKTKAALAKLAPNRRRYVIQNFKATAQGDAGVTELESFLEECGKNGVWDKLSTPGLVPVSGVRPASVATIGLKRPLTPLSVISSTVDQNKKLRLTIPTPAATQTAPVSALAAKLAAARTQGGIRPVGAVAPKPVGAVSGIRPNTITLKTAAVTPVRPVGAAKAQPAQPKGALIRNLLKKL